MEKLRILRRRAGLTQEELAVRAGIGQGSLSDIENGRRRPSYDVMNRIADALGVSPGDLFTRSSNEAQILDTFHGIPREHQDAALHILKMFARSVSSKKL
jgi:transcriptional regulator with XRE-family HTH domain